jgi:SAM-dependent methyltransferase
MACVGGPSVEIGGGPGTMKEHIPGVISSDLSGSPWLDFAANAESLPFADGSVSNLLMVDVLHHLSRPQRFLREASRVLSPGGRIVVLDVFLSPASWPVFAFLHPEPATLGIRPLDHGADDHLFDATNPLNSDQGMCRAMFWKQRACFERVFPELRIVHRACFSTLLWPLSGGFEQKDRAPRWALPLLRPMERVLEPFSRLLGFRSLIVLERS